MPLVLTGDGAVGPLSASEVGFLDGVTSSVQTQINAKANDASQGFYFITSQTFSAASAVNVNNCFSSTYDNYRVVIRVTGSNSVTLNSRMRLSGSDVSGANYDYAQRFATTGGTTGDQGSGANQTAWITTSVSNIVSSLAFDIISPAIAATTDMFGVYVYNSTSVFFGGSHKVSTAYDGISFYPTAGTITGTLRIYGLRN